MSGFIYVMTNPCFSSGTGPVKMYKIGYTIDMEQREKNYQTAFPLPCIYEVQEKTTSIKTRERVIFKRLNECRFNSSREYFFCDITKIKDTINQILSMSLKEMNLELNIKEWKVEVPIFLKKVIKEVNKGKNYNKVIFEDLYRLFVVWCMAKNIKKKIKEEEFANDLENGNYKLKPSGRVINLKNTNSHPKEYLEMMEYNI